ncbi:copper chaperone PCu(A)C [Streptomyces sp. NPDC048643]|uniref:copper chaperone PCu(A)C n=1 Tax=Streptomyces sp. NPDC048643 TaxID=3155637 RepID=UPI003440C88A
MRSLVTRAVSVLGGDRRRLTDAALAVLVPVAACSMALAFLTTWVRTGEAGSPAHVAVTEGQLLLPSAGVPETAVFFRIGNDGGSADRLLSVSSPDVPGGVTLSRHRMTGGGAAHRETIDSVAIREGTTLAMSPDGVDLTVSAATARWRPGDLVPFTLDFRRGGRIEVFAVVVRPGTASFS